MSTAITTKDSHALTTSQAVKSQIEGARTARKRVSRKDLGRWEPTPGRADPVDILEAQSRDRIQDLVPIRYGRMLESPFAFLRGSAAVMAADLASLPNTGLFVQLCGDAHLANFGLFASPERHLRFGINDFDETAPGPFEWDVKRLAASVAVVGLELGLDDGDCRSATLAMGMSYQRHIAAFARMRAVDVWYSHIREDDVLNLARRAQVSMERVRKVLGRARSRDHLRAQDRLTSVVDGRLMINLAPPLLVPMSPSEVEAASLNFDAYVATAPAEHHHLLNSYQIQDVALKVVGVGSVGTRCWLALLTGRDDGDPLFLQMKEANDSVLAPAATAAESSHNGERVVYGQKLIQSSSDPFLGWVHGRDGHDYYVRQLWDMKGDFDPLGMSSASLGAYAGACAWELARAHARTGDRVAISAYIGNSDRFARAITRFAEAYARQTIADHAALAEAERSGRIVATRGI